MKRIITSPAPKFNGDPERPIATFEDIATAAYHTAHEYPGEVPALARVMAMSQNTLNNKVNLHNDTHHLTLRETALMMEVSSDFRVLHALAARSNHVCLSMGAETEGITARKVQILIKEFSDVLSEVTETSCKKSLCENDLKRIEKEGAEMVAAFNGLVKNMRGQLASQRKGGL